MATKEPICLENFLTDSLSLQINATCPTRNIYPTSDKDPYLDLIQQNPLEVLGETEFFQRAFISEDTEGSPIEEFYRGAHVLITGGSGFIGKVLTEKLVRSIPHLGHIYLLIRSKRGKSSQERFEQLMKDRLFHRVSKEVPEYISKITAIDGNLSEPGLGLSVRDRQLLSDKVHVVFHSAADVRFIEPLRLALESNVLGSKRVLDLAKEMKYLKSYVHVSTAYSQCVRRVIEENIPLMSIHYKEILSYVESRSDEKLLEETPRIMQGWPNTYTFSKALGEILVQEEGKGMPICIIRPSVVMPTYKEPVRGWTDNLYGPVGMFVGTGHGVLHCFRIDDELAVDNVPVDYVVNCMLGAAWDVYSFRDERTMPVYNFTSARTNPSMCWKNFIEFALSKTDIWPFSRAIWYPNAAFYTRSYLMNETGFYLLHKLPALFIDKLAELYGEKFRLSRIYDTMHSLKGQVRYFSIRTWVFQTDRVVSLWQSLDDEDKLKFQFDMRTVDYKEHFLVSMLGIRYYFMKDTMESLPAAKLKNTRLFWIHNSVKVISCLAVLKLMVIIAHALPL